MSSKARRAGMALVLGWTVAAAAASAGDAESKPTHHPDQVVVVNGPDEAVPVRVVGKAPDVPWQRPFALDWVDGQDLSESTYVVPANKRLVIEYASLFAYLPPDGQSMFVRILTSAGGSQAFHTLAVDKQEDYGVLKQFGAAHLVRIYADPGSTVKVAAGRTPFANTASATVSLSGRLEPMP
jgi:hypothetical protein